MIATIFHRARNPYVYQISDSKIKVVLKAQIGTIKKVVVFYGDPMGGREKKHWTSSCEVAMQKIAVGMHHDYYEAVLASRYKRFRYAFIIDTHHKKFMYGESGVFKNKLATANEGIGFTYAYWNKINFLHAPQWSRHVNWYQIFADRFASNKAKSATWNNMPQAHEICGGDLKGIMSKIAYIKALGFNGIYITPIFKATTAHRYDTTNYYQIDPILGNEQDLKQLVKECHRQGIKVMIDAVFNHMGATSRQWQDVIKHGIKSKYYDWFWINDAQALKQPQAYNHKHFSAKYPYETFALVPTMPRINWSHAPAREHLLKAAEKWTKFGIDGWRLDVAFAPDCYFWRDFKKRISAIKKDILIIGEVWWDAIDYVQGDMWHGMMNYPLRTIILDYVCSSQSRQAKKHFFKKFNDWAFKYTPEQQWGMFNLLSSHDTPRLISFLNDSQQDFELANNMLFALPGATATYYGEESNLQGHHDPDNRRTMNWQTNKATNQTFYHQLIHRRKNLVNQTNVHERCIASIEKNHIIFCYENYKIMIEN